jgi:hypothetical protein
LIVGAIRLHVFSVELDATRLALIAANGAIGAAFFSVVGYVQHLRRQNSN